MSKFKDWKVGQYLRELSIITIGIAITFGGNEYISHINAKKSLHEELRAVKAELEENKREIEEIISYYDKVYLYQDLVKGKKTEDVDPDSLKTYSHTLSQIVNYNYKKDAFDMMKYSGRLSDIKDKSFILSVIECYRLMEQAKETHDAYMERKIDLLTNSLGIDGAMNIIPSSEFQSAKIKAFILLWSGMEAPFLLSKKQIDKVLSEDISSY